jgi:hypothetical protein
VNFVANFYKPGPATTLFTALNPTWDNFPGTQQYFMEGNVMPGRFDESNQPAGRTASGSNGGSVPTTYSPWVSAPFFPNYVSTHSAGEAYKRVLSDVGANQPLDDHDTRVIAETRDGTFAFRGSRSGLPGLPDSQDDVGGWEAYPELRRGAAWDHDRDGLPDWWEAAHGLDPRGAVGDFSETNADPDGDGYTRLEDYLAWLAQPRAQSVADAAVDVDLSRWTRGYTASPVHMVSDPVNGAVTLLADGKTARFTPTAGFRGLGSFRFSVSDAQGGAMSGIIGVRVRAATAPVLEMRRVGAAIELEFEGEAGRTYTIQSATQLPQWSNVMTVQGAGAMQVLTMPAASGEPQRFFRAVQAP